VPNTATRVVGSGFTTFNYRGKPIAFMDEVRDSGQRAIGGGGGGAAWEAIYSLDKNRAVEIATSRVLSTGTLTMSIRELWHEDVWQQLAGLENVRGVITDVFAALARDPSSVTCQMLIKPPGSTVWRGKTYHNCVITEIPDDETVTLGALTVAKMVAVTYTHKTYMTQAGR